MFPSVTSLFVGPVMSRFVLSVPAVSLDLSGRLIASAGRNDSRSVAGSPSPASFRSTTNSSPSDLYVPLKWDLAFPIFTVEGFSTPVPLAISYLVSKFRPKGTPDGFPPAISSAFDSFRLPFVAICPPWLTRFASMSTVPPRPREGSRNPVFARSSALIVSFTSWGVNAASCASTGPTLPSIFMVPPPGSPIEKTSGNWLFIETSLAVRFTGAYTVRFCEFVLPSVIWPSFSSSFLIDKDCAALLPDPRGSAGAFPPMEEKFQFPVGSFSIITCGLFDDDLGDVHLFGKDQRQQFHADPDRTSPSGTAPN